MFRELCHGSGHGRARAPEGRKRAPMGARRGRGRQPTPTASAPPMTDRATHGCPRATVTAAVETWCRCDNKCPSSWLEPRDCALFVACISTVPARREPLGAGACAAVGAARAAGEGGRGLTTRHPPYRAPARHAWRHPKPAPSGSRRARTQRDSHNAQCNRAFRRACRPRCSSPNRTRRRLQRRSSRVKRHPLPAPAGTSSSRRRTGAPSRRGRCRWR